jgi:hypothetical protein
MKIKTVTLVRIGIGTVGITLDGPLTLAECLGALWDGGWLPRPLEVHSGALVVAIDPLKGPGDPEPISRSMFSTYSRSVSHV